MSMFKLSVRQVHTSGKMALNKYLYLDSVVNVYIKKCVTFNLKQYIFIPKQ